MDADDELVQVAERALADAEEALRRDPSEANQRRVMSAWAFLRKTRERHQQAPGPPTRSVARRSRMPDWIGPPERTLPGVVMLELLLVHNARLAVWIAQADAYPTGVVLKVVLCGREPARPGIERGPGTWRLGVQLPDGREATTLGVGLESSPGAIGMIAGLAPNRNDRAPRGPLLRARGGGGSRSMWHQDYWLWPVPPAGDLLISFEWPDLEVALTTATISGDQLQKAAGRARQLWPAEDLPA